MRQTFLGILIAVAGASCLSAQRYSFKFYGEDEGLQDLRVQAVLQDRAGFLWVGTQNGLYRYDGSRFTGFGKTEGLPGASIESLYESRDGTFWVGTQTGLARRKGERFETVPLNVADGVTGREGIVSDRSGRLYLATERGLLAGVDTPTGFKFSLIPLPEGVLGPQVLSVYADSNGTVWYGCGNSLCRIEDRSGRLAGSVFGNDAGLPSDGRRG